MATDDRFGVAASDLRGCTVRGFLDKKRPSKKLLSVKYQRRWCVLHDSTLYYFFDPRDRRQKGSFSLIGYKFWHGGTENSFSLVASGKRTYDFICPTSEDFEKWKAGILAVTENVPLGHEVFVNKKSMHNNITSSPTTNKKTLRKKSLSRESSSDSTDMEIPPSRPPPVTRPPKRPPMPPVPKAGKTPVTKKQSEPSIDVYAAVNKSQLSRSNTAIPITTPKTNDDLDDYDVVENHMLQSDVKKDDLDDYDVVDKHMKHSDISTDSDDEIYDRAGDPPEPVYSFARQHSTQSVSSSDSEVDYARVNPRSSDLDDYASTTEIQMLRRTSSGYDKPYEIENLKKESDFQNSNESSYLTSADLHGPKSSNHSPNKQMESSIASLLGLKLKGEKQTISCDADFDTYVEFIAEGVKQAPSSKNSKSKKKRHIEESVLNSVPEDPYMEFVGEGGLGEEGEEEEDEDEAFQSEDSSKDSDIVQTKNTKNEAKQKKPLSQIHSLQLELNTKLVQRLQGARQVTSPDKEPDVSGEDEPLYENFLKINSLETRSLPRDILPASPTLQLHKRKQSSFESNSDSSSEDEFPPCVSMSH
ncbi:uncharacterized protein LOC133178634 isoform X2 [Saccostrea echinata]|uniref:uncharacterized protein LOC133178634 isoform X2 n=1 Tax=Saccostrea echinata TaxID=191078 RepID=UPI002A81D8EC|nr:uncharacterized protein LOC133178634 isoform X2 [Saccostrea echinata]